MAESSYRIEYTSAPFSSRKAHVGVEFLGSGDGAFRGLFFSSTMSCQGLDEQLDDTWESAKQVKLFIE